MDESTNPAATGELLQKFLVNFKAQGGDVEQLAKYRYGGVILDDDEDEFTPENIAHLHQYWNFVSRKYGLLEPEMQTRCLCETAIKWNHVIFNPETKQVHVVGSVCQGKFLGSPSKECQRCQDLFVFCTRSNRNVYCRACRKIVEKEINTATAMVLFLQDREITYGKFVGQTFKWISDNQPRYAAWTMDQEAKTKGMRDFQKYLKANVRASQPLLYQ
jgi:hypothetical protein